LLSLGTGRIKKRGGGGSHSSSEKKKNLRNTGASVIRRLQMREMWDWVALSAQEEEKSQGGKRQVGRHEKIWRNVHLREGKKKGEPQNSKKCGGKKESD